MISIFVLSTGLIGLTETFILFTHYLIFRLQFQLEVSCCTLYGTIFYDKAEVVRHKPMLYIAVIYISKHSLQGTAFYEKLIQKLQQKYCYKLDDFLDTSSLPPENIHRFVKLAILSTQRNMICLGDIARYREQMNDSGKINYGRARKYVLLPTSTLMLFSSQDKYRVYTYLNCFRQDICTYMQFCSSKPFIA